MSDAEAAAWVQGFLCAHHMDHGSFVPNRTDLEPPWHLIEQMRWWNPYIDEAEPEDDD